MAQKKKPRPARTLSIFVLCVAVLYGIVALIGTWKPTLGLDLQGGTRITLTAVDSGSGAITTEKLQEAAGIIESRVNGNGVAESDVTTQGDRNIVVEIPGQNRKDLVDSVSRTAQLRFRLVVGQPQQGTPLPSPTASPSSSAGASSGASSGATPSSSASAVPSGASSPAATPSAGASPTATPKGRPAPNIDVPEASVTPSPSPAAASPSAASPSSAASASPGAGAATPTPSAPSASTPATTGTSGQTAQGAPVSQPTKWVANPGTAWLTRYGAYTCPTGKAAAKPVIDDPDRPLITCDSTGAKFLLSKAVIEGTQLKTASSGIPQGETGYAVFLTFKGSAVKTFGDVTGFVATSGGTFATVLDGKVISYASAQAALRDGSAQISGGFTEASARSLANSLKYGALPIRFESPPSSEVIGPSLAGDQLSAGLIAGVIGLLIVMIYCLLYYRALGLVVVASLVIAAGVTYAVVLALAKTAGFTLTLPGIAGLIVAVGITADSFIVYFERIRDEMRGGRSMRVAVETGWTRARNTCLAADAVSLLAAVVLYIFAIGVVRGFAFALGVSTLIDIVVFFYFTKPMMSLLAKRPFFNGGGRLSGLSPESLGIDHDGPRRSGSSAATARGSA